MHLISRTKRQLKFRATSMHAVGTQDEQRSQQLSQQNAQPHRKSPIYEISRLLTEAVQHGLRCIAFCKTRKLSELVLSYTRCVSLASWKHRSELKCIGISLPFLQGSTAARGTRSDLFRVRVPCRIHCIRAQRHRRVPLSRTAEGRCSYECARARH